MSLNTNRPKKFSFFDLFRSQKDNIKASRTSETAVREEVSVPTNLEKKRLTDTLWWTFENGVLTIGGEGMMPDFQWCSRKAFPWPDQETVAVIISEGVLRIGAGSFLRCSNLSEVTLPASLCAIGAYAFEATGINEIALPKGLVCIEDSVFKSCKQLSKVIIPDSVAEIKRHSFEYCEKLTYVHLPNSLKRIGSHAFYGTGITEIELPDGLEMIGKTAFGHLSHLMIPDSVTQCETPIAFPCPVQFPKGREDMPVFEPKTDEDYFRQFAYQFFSARPDVLEEPTGEPAKDRYTAITRLLEIMQQYFHAKPNRLYDSYASKGELFLCNDAEIEYGESCADGGCGPSYETICFGLTFSIITENELCRQRSEMQFAQSTPFSLWKSKDGKRCLLRHPLGLSDCFSVHSDYAVIIPENKCRKYHLSDLGNPKHEDYEPPMPTAEQEAELRQIGAEFFGSRTGIFVNSSGNEEQDRLESMKRIYAFTQSLTEHFFYGRSGEHVYTLLNNINRPRTVKNGVLEYTYMTTYHTCYDGGCYSDDQTDWIMRIHLLDPAAPLPEKRVDPDDCHSALLNYYGKLPYGNPEILFDREAMYLIRPFGFNFNLSVEDDRS